MRCTAASAVGSAAFDAVLRSAKATSLTVLWPPNRQVIGVRETWLHPGLPALSAPLADGDPEQPLSSATAKAANGHSTAQPQDANAEADTPEEPTATAEGQIESQLEAASLEDQ